MPQPKVVLPKTEILAKGPPAGLNEVAQSLSATAVSFAQALPAGGLKLPGLPGQGQGEQAKLGLPKLKQFALSIEEEGPPFMPKLSQAAEQVEKVLAGSPTQTESTQQERTTVGGQLPETKSTTAGQSKLQVKVRSAAD